MENKYPTPSAQVAARIVDGQAVIVLSDSGEVEVLNEVGTRLWGQMDGRHSLGEIAADLAREYELTPETAARDVDEFLGKLIESGAVELRDSPA